MASPPLRVISGSLHTAPKTRERRTSEVRLSAPERTDEESFERALCDEPENDELWQELEAECERTGDPDRIAQTYLRMLTPDLAPEVRRRLAQKAHAFYQTWLGDDVDALQRLLWRVLELDPATDWALHEMVGVLTAAERWDSLLEAYELALGGELCAEQRARLLDEAAHVAKDFADGPERAVRYLRELTQLDTRAGALAASVGRLLQERALWLPLIELLQVQAAMRDAPTAALWLQIATLYLDREGDPAQALRYAAQVLESRPGDAEACVLVRRVLALEAADVSLRLAALTTLRRHHELAGRPEETAAALDIALGFVAGAQHVALLRELAERLLSRADYAGAQARYAELLRRVPGDLDAMLQLQRLAERSGDHEAHARALEAAAAQADAAHVRAALTLEAMGVRSARLHQQELTLELGRSVLALAEAEPLQKRRAALLMEGPLRGGERHAERLCVLETLCASESDPAAQKLLLAELARVAVACGERARALAAWDARLAADAGDLTALAAAIDLAGELSLYEVQLARLQQRAQLRPSDAQRRQDLVRSAELQAAVLQQPEAAIATWYALREEFGDAPDVLGALDQLLGQGGQFGALARIYEAVTGQDHVACVENLCRLGELYRAELSEPLGALRCYARVLELTPDGEQARQGLRALLAVAPEHAAQITTVLARAYEATDDWQLCIELLDARLAASPCTKTQARLLLEAAELCEQRGGLAQAALSLVGKALTRAPLDGHVERELLRLAVVTGHYREAAVALSWAAAICSDRERAADLKAQEGRLFERIDDHGAASQAYLEVLKVRPDARGEAAALVRTAARAGQWQLACAAALDSCQLRGVAEPALLEQLANAAHEQHAERALRDAFEAALRALPELGAPLGYSLESWLCAWCLEHCDDVEGAERAARRAVDQRPDCAAGLARLVELQRRCGSPALLDTLLALSERAEETFEPLYEAARAALALRLPPERQRALLRRLYRRVSALCAAGQPLEQGALAACLTWTLECLVPLELALEGGAVGVRLLDEAARLPLQDRERVQLGIQCARLLEQQGDIPEALRMGLCALERAPEDLALVRWLAQLCAKLRRLPDELSLRKQELALERDAERRLALRLAIARLTGALEAQDGRLAMLRQNLRERCGHQPSLQAACELLAERGRFGELVELLSEQASALEAGQQRAGALPLWRRAAELAESELKDLELAIHAHTCAVRSGEASSIEELVRLCRLAGDPARTAHWLAQQIESAAAHERARLYVRLAREQLAAERADEAIETLRRGFDRHPEDSALRTLLIDQLRAAGRERDLAEVLADAASLVEDRAHGVELAREAARLLHATSHDPEALVRTAERALASAPEDRELSLLLAEGLSTLGRRAAARQVLSDLLGGFGRRHSAERGLVHARLSAVLRDDGDLVGACEQLELALKMRSQDVEIMYALAELAGRAGEPGRRERALHALRLAAKRGPLHVANEQLLGSSEILLQLAELAQARGDAAHASSLRESALESLTVGDAECARVERYASERGDLDTLELIVRKQLALEPREVARAACMERLADVLDRKPGAAEDAFALRLQAVELDPANPRLHEAALEAARKRGELGRLRALLEGLLERARRPSDACARCEICLRLGEVWLHQAAPEQASECYREAEASGVREADVWRAQLRLALDLGDARMQQELLARLSGAGETQLGSESRSELLYRMAEIRLGSPATRAEGIGYLREALAVAPHTARVTRLLSRAFAQAPGAADLLAFLSELSPSRGEAELLQLGELYAERGEEALLTALLAPLAEEGAAKSLRAVLRARRAARLLRAPDCSEQARDLLLQALSDSPDCLEAEDMLLACCAAGAEQAPVIEHLLRRFEHVHALGDADACARHALQLSGLSAARAVRVQLLRAAAELCPARVALWQALRQALSEPEHALERARAVEHLLELQAAPDATAAALEAAEIYERAGDLAAVVRVLSCARRAAPEHVEVQRRLMDTFRAQNDLAALATLIEQLARAEHDAGRAEGLWQEATSLWRDGLDDLAASVAALESAVAALPRHAGFRRQLADALLAVGRDEAAIAQLAHAIECCEDDTERAQLLRARAKALLDQGHLLEGIVEIERSVELRPLALERALLDRAQELCRRAAERLDAPATRAATLKLAAILRARGELADAAALLEVNLARGAHDDEVLEPLVELYAQLQRPEEAARMCIARMALGTGEAQVALAQRLSALVPQLADPEPALTALARAHTQQAECAALEQALFDAQLARRDHGALGRLYIARARRAQDPKQRVESLHQAAKHLLASGAVQNALSLLQRVYSTQPEQLEVALTLAEALVAAGRAAEARETLEAMLKRASELRPVQRAQLLVQRARVARVEGQHELALTCMQSARDADKNSRAILTELAVLAEELQAWEVAERALIALLMLKQCDVMPRAEVLMRRARVAVHLAGPAQALLWARKAREAAPDSAEAEELIASLRKATHEAAGGPRTAK